MTEIPIGNVYYLLCYALGHAQRLRQSSREVLNGPDHLGALLGRVLAEAVGGLMKRGLDRGYIPKRETLAGLRGKLLVGETGRGGLDLRARTHCEFDELSHDVLQNRIIRATLTGLARVEDLDGETRDRLLVVRRSFPRVAEIRLDGGVFSRVRVHRNNRLYGFVLSICRLIHDNLLVDENTGRARFYDFRRDEATMWQLFEDFAREFYRVEADGWRVSRPNVPWAGAEGLPAHMDMLPAMQTDIVLEGHGRRIVLDTKFYRETTSGRADIGGRAKVRSANLYQLLTYLGNLERVAPRSAGLPADPRWEGVLLYPEVGRVLDLRYRLMGHPVALCTVDLAADWGGIHERMLEVVGRDGAAKEVSVNGVPAC